MCSMVNHTFAFICQDKDLIDRILHEFYNLPEDKPDVYAENDFWSVNIKETYFVIHYCLWNGDDADSKVIQISIDNKLNMLYLYSEESMNFAGFTVMFHKDDEREIISHHYFGDDPAERRNKKIGELSLPDDLKQIANDIFPKSE